MNQYQGIAFRKKANVTQNENSVLEAKVKKYAEALRSIADCECHCGEELCVCFVEAQIIAKEALKG